MPDVLSELRSRAGRDGAGDTGEYIEWLERLVLRYEHGIRAISNSTLEGVDFGDWVQSVCEDLLAGEYAACPDCGAPVHEGPCGGGR